MLSRTLLSRALLLRTVKNAADNVKQAKRNSGHGAWSYRVPPPMPSKKSVYLAEFMGGIVWWWILYHIATQYDHLIGEWKYVDPKTWTNEELGVPPDSEGPLKH